MDSMGHFQRPFFQLLGYKSSKPWLLPPSHLCFPIEVASIPASLSGRFAERPGCLSSFGVGGKWISQDFSQLRTKEATFFDGFGYKFLPWFGLKSETSKVSWRLEPLNWFKREFQFFWERSWKRSKSPKIPKAETYLGGGKLDESSQI